MKQVIGDIINDAAGVLRSLIKAGASLELIALMQDDEKVAKSMVEAGNLYLRDHKRIVIEV